MDNPGSWLPEPNAVLLCRRSEEIVDLSIFVHRAKQVLLGTHFSTNEMIAMDRARHSRFFLIGLHELQHGHLGRGILHGHTIWPERQHRLAPLPGLRVEIICVRDQDFVSQGEASAELLSGLGKHLRHLGIQFLGEIHRHDLSP